MTATDRVPEWFRKKFDPKRESLRDYLNRATRELMHPYDPITKTGIKGYDKFKNSTLLDIMNNIQKEWFKDNAVRRPSISQKQEHIIIVSPVAQMNIPRTELFMGVKVQTRSGVRYQYPKGTFINGKNVSGRFFRGKIYNGYYQRY